MARPKKPDDQLTRPRTIKKPDGTAVLGKGRPPKTGVKVQIPVSELKRMLDPVPPAVPYEPEYDADVEIGTLTPLEYALQVMNDPRQPKDRRDRLCVAAMPFVHTKKGEGGKREKTAEDADKASRGKFGALPQPLRAVK